ncbi:MAG: glyoxylate/hydroxypyruvate reductase A [Colwelliaceae bacterium]|nr:glyoxylate/hydroxypyruvate reductase A [Colwelliaceae bacterium]
MTKIVFINQLAAQEEQKWLTQIKVSLPDEIVVLSSDLAPSDTEHVDIAIVANPSPEELARFQHLKWVQSLWAGVEQIAPMLSDKATPLVRLIDPTLAQTMAESVLAWTLYLQRNMATYQRQQSEQLWQALPTVAAKDLRVTVLGVGELGIKSLNLLGKLDYQLQSWSRTEKHIEGVAHFSGEDGLSKVLKKTDILISLLPLTDATRYLLNQEKLGLLPRGAQLINFSRGAIIDGEALIEKLDNGHIAHAVLDVFEQEPLPVGSAFWQHPKITVLPHISAPTNKETAAKIVADNIKHYRATGDIPNAVNMKLGY